MKRKIYTPSVVDGSFYEHSVTNSSGTTANAAKSQHLAKQKFRLYTGKKAKVSITKNCKRKQKLHGN